MVDGLAGIHAMLLPPTGLAVEFHVELAGEVATSGLGGARDVARDRESGVAGWMLIRGTIKLALGTGMEPLDGSNMELVNTGSWRRWGCWGPSLGATVTVGADVPAEDVCGLSGMTS